MQPCQKSKKRKSQMALILGILSMGTPGLMPETSEGKKEKGEV
jgi:hypothetical protein